MKNGTEDSITFKQIDALIRFHLKIDPDELSLEKYNEVAGGLLWCLSKNQHLKAE